MAPIALHPPTPPTTGKIPLILDQVNGLTQSSAKKLQNDSLQEIFDENIFAKLIRVAVRDLKDNVSIHITI